MKFPLSANTFPKLELTPTDKRKIEEAAEVVVKKTIVQYHEHLTVDSSVVDEKGWKKIKEREDVRVYLERKMAPNARESMPSNVSESSVEESKTMISMLTFGSIQGNLDDVMYGVVNPTTEAMQLISAYVENGFVDWSVLASIIKPSEQDPFRELDLKWIVKSHPGLLGSMMRTRDVVYIESSGIAVTPNGERIGYHVKNSVDISEIRVLNEFNIVRVTISVCEFFRQRKDSCVEVYARTVFDPMGDAPISLAASSGAEVEVTVFKYVYCAEMKKLRRIVGSRDQLALLQGTAVSSNLSSIASSDGLDASFAKSSSSAISSSTSMCGLCTQNTSGGVPFTSSKRKPCRICSLHVCSRCRVTKTLFLPTEKAKQLQSKDMVFCTRCILVSSCASSATFAALDALAMEGKTVDYSEALH